MLRIRRSHTAAAALHWYVFNAASRAFRISVASDHDIAGPSGAKPHHLIGVGADLAIDKAVFLGRQK
jgi:hypothetical protein